MRVAHLDHTTEHGGAELALRRLLAVNDRGWDATLVIPAGIGRGIFEHCGGEFRVVEVGKAQPPGASQTGLVGALGVAAGVFRQAWSIRRSGVLRDVDVVHANSSRSALYAALATLGTRVPLVVHLRDRIEPDAIGSIGFKAFALLVVRRATHFIANSNATADTLERMRRPSQQLDVIPSPIGVDRVAAQAPADVAHPIHIGMIARLDAWKGQAELIRAFQKADLGSGAELTLYGDASFGKEEYARELADIAARVPDAAVRFAGFITNVEEAIDGLDICVQFSTRPEPLGQNVLQYLARGRAVIAAAEGGPMEWIENEVNGILVPPRDEDALAAALRRLSLDSNLRARLGEAARATEQLPTDSAVAARHAHAFAAAKRGR